MEFEWDKVKALNNLKKHRLSFQEAATVFADQLALTFHDPDHSINELRYLTFGVTRAGRHVIVSHTELNDIMRIISARLMTKLEKDVYEEGGGIEEMRSEYKRQELGKGVRGKYHAAFKESHNIVLLEPEVARAFKSEEDVNRALLGLIREKKKGSDPL